VVRGGSSLPAGASRLGCRRAPTSEACSRWGEALNVTHRRAARGGAVTPIEQHTSWRNAPAVTVVASDAKPFQPTLEC
jgi:hypothetical protein